MTTEFDALRSKAKQKRDAAIAKAKQEYRQTLKQIAALQKSLIGGSPRKRRTKEEGATLRETIVAVLGNRKMTKLELTVAVLEAGYKTIMPKQELCRCVGQFLRRDGRFKREGDKWFAAS